jgi:iron(III) transport system permease protein
MSRALAVTVYLLTAALFGFFFLFPIVQTLGGAFISNGRLTFAFVTEVFRNPLYVEGLRNSFFLGLFGTLAALGIAMPLAWLSDRYDFPGKKIFGALVLAPLILPPFVGAIGIKKIFGQMGALNAALLDVGWLREPIDWLGRGRFWGCVFLIGLNLYPVLYLNLTAALANIDPAMEESAENLGCTGFRKFRRVTLPLILPGLFAGGTIVFIWAFTELGVPLIFEFERVTSVQIFYGLKDIGGSPFPYALVAVMLTATVLLYALGRFTLGRGGLAMLPKANVAGGPRRLGFAAGLACAAAFALVSFLALLPHVGITLFAFSRDWYGTILPQSFTLANFETALGHNLTVPSIANSLKYAGLATILDVFLGVAVAYIIVRTQFPGRKILDTVAMLPLAVPGLVLAFGYLAMTQEGKIFSFLNPAKNPLPLLVIAYAVRRFPYMVRSAVAGFEQTSVTLEEAAHSLGCPPLRTLRRITVPLIAANLIAGGLLTFSFAMLEVSDSLILAQRQADYPITKAIFELFQLLGDGRAVAAALGVWAMVFLGFTILVSSLVLGKRLGALFRV